MYLSDLVFPKRIAMGVQRGARWDTTLIATQGGRVLTIQDWEDALHEYDLSHAVRTAADYDLIVQHFHSARGRRHTFPLRDPLDYRVTVARGVVIDADQDSPTTAFQLAKTYGTSASSTWQRHITRPVSGSVAIYRLRASVTTDITGSATIDYTNGHVTFGGSSYLPGSGDVLSWSGEFVVPCRYADDALPGVIVDKRVGQSDLDQLLVRCDSVKLLEDRGG